jgi:cold shock CspA family protein
MRFQGKIISWNEGRGFGFIQWNGGNDKVFAHISSFAERQRKPSVGDIVTYEVTKDERGRTRAKKVAFISATNTKTTAKTSPAFTLGRFATIGLIAALSIGAYLQYKPQEAFTSHVLSANPPTVIETTFRCEGKTRCSQMSSCEEAQFYLRNCPGTEMDGDRDGVPCESQWCSL